MGPFRSRRRAGGTAAQKDICARNKKLFSNQLFEYRGIHPHERAHGACRRPDVASCGAMRFGPSPHSCCGVGDRAGGPGLCRRHDAGAAAKLRTMIAPNIPVPMDNNGIEAGFSDNDLGHVRPHFDNLILACLALGPGPTNSFELAFDMTRRSRKDLRSGLPARLKVLTRMVAAHIERPLDGMLLPGSLCCDVLKVMRLPAPSRRASGQNHLHQFNRIRGS